MLTNKKNKDKKVHCMFVQGDCSKSIEDNSAFKTGETTTYTNDNLSISELINQSIFSTIIEKEIPSAMKGVIAIYNKGTEKFDIGSSQFAMHYFFKSQETVQQFINNLKYTIKIGGYFIGTCYDGNRVLDLLINHQYEYKTRNNISIKLNNNDAEDTEDAEDAEDDDTNSKLKKRYNTNIGGVSIVVKETGFNDQEEYLVNFKLFDDLMKRNGFSKKNSTSFKNRHNFLVAEDQKTQEIEGCIMKDEEEKEISFLNERFMYEHVGINGGGNSIPFETVPIVSMK